ncbi:hypothetical protein DFQ28_009834 [Apophysomyces sp. BC1034]|nr:hypothetical protein DFQ30_009151 [Apophysomyces sp. BC1015]KAG0172434.1 hypothetical protein DFQ29_008397 [Apophysomyces sp. BC1021]KAG0185179.1 hypothetical protein DFQ28_009834 [Apophysomyces sp. BC1034]
MPCLGSRKKAKRKSKQPETASIRTTHSAAVAQIRQEYNELKTKNDEHLDVIARQSVELEQLRQRLEQTPTQKQPQETDVKSVLENLESSNRESLAKLQQKEALLEQREKEIQELMQKIGDNGTTAENKLAEKDELLRTKEKQLEEMQMKWKAERAELVKPALEEVTFQLDRLKITNEEAVQRLAEKENELVELRAELSRRDRKPKKQNASEDQERQKRLNRLTMDLESDRLMIQKLEELNQQLEAQKQQHEMVIQSHAEAMAEKDRVLEQHQESLTELKQSHHHAIHALERKQRQTFEDLESRHERDLSLLKQRLNDAEKQAQSSMNDEVEKLLHEFEQSEHDHSVQVASLQKSHQEQLSVLRTGQQAELRDLEKSNGGGATTMKLRKTTSGPSKVMRWPVIMKDQAPELTPRDPCQVQVYVSSVSANSTIKRNQDTLQTMLTSNQVQYQIVDVAQSEPALQHMRQQSKGANSGRVKALPQVFVGGQYRGQLEDCLKALEENQLDHFLRPRDEEQVSRSKEFFSSSRASSEPITPTNSSTVSTIGKKLYEEDAELLKEIELELAQSNISSLDFNF